MKHPNKPSAQPTVWDSQWQKRRFVWTKSHTRFAIFAVVGVLCVAFLWWRVYNLGPESPQDLRNDFYTYVFERMEEYKHRYALYDQLADPAALMQGEHWETTTAADAQSAAQALLGEGCTLQNWEKLIAAEKLTTKKLTSKYASCSCFSILSYKYYTEKQTTNQNIGKSLLQRRYAHY